MSVTTFESVKVVSGHEGFSWISHEVDVQRRITTKSARIEKSTNTRHGKLRWH